MKTVGVRELKQRASELIRLVREERQAIQITYHGDVVALLIPVASPVLHDEKAAWAAIDQLATEIGARWPEGVTAAEAVSESRR